MEECNGFGGIQNIYVAQRENIEEKVNDSIKEKMLEYVKTESNNFKTSDELVNIIIRLSIKEEEKLSKKIEKLNLQIKDKEFWLEDSYSECDGYDSERLEEELEKLYSKRRYFQSELDSNKITIFGTKEQYAEFIRDIRFENGLRLSHIEMSNLDCYIATPTTNIVVVTKENYNNLSYVKNEDGSVTIKNSVLIGVEFLFLEGIFKQK